MYRRAIRRKQRVNSMATQPQPAPLRAAWPPLSSLAGVPSRAPLVIGAANDPAERAADAAADRVMGRGATIRREAAGAGRAGQAPAGPQAQKALSGLGAGTVLPASERAFFEPRFGRDLSGVRIHDGPAADAASQSVAARAFTLGSDIAFARGEYRPGTGEGRRLLAHELAHVMQPQGGVLRREPQRGLEDQPGNMGGTLPYREATNLLDCIRIMGPGSEDYCNNEVLGTPMPPLKFGDMAVAMFPGAGKVSGTVSFTPNAKCPKCSTIRLVQVVRVYATGGADHKFAGTAERNRDKVKTKADKKNGIVGNFFVDHFAAKCSKGNACSIYYRDHAPNSHRSRDGSFDGTTGQAASLFDAPQGPANYVFEFETCARCADTGTYLGCVDWGFTNDAAGTAALTTTAEHFQPSATFRSAIAVFNKFYANP